MKSPIYVFGHRNPDTDSICSTIAYSELKRKLGIENVIPCRLGEINKETSFVLDYFNADLPLLLSDIRMKLRDLELYNPVRINKKDPIKKAWDVLKEGRGSRLIPVVEKHGKLEGMLALGDITKMFMEPVDEELFHHYEISFDNLVQILGGKVVAGYYNYERLCGNLFIGSVVTNDGLLCDKDVIITGKVENARYYANERNCGCIILTNDYFPVELEKAKCAVVCVKHTLFRTVSLVSQAISVGSIMNTQNFETFSTESAIEDAAELMKTSSHRNFPVLDREGRFFGIISRRHLIEYDRKQVILIDHNERHQSVEGLEQTRIIEIIDHHRIADIQTDSPLYIRSEPVGCSATIVYKLYQENNIDINKKVAGLLLGAILSDTLMFRSPTCTAKDRAVAEELSDKADVDIGEFGGAMFAAGTSLEGYTPEQIVNVDRKNFTFGKFLITIAQINTLDFKTISDQKTALKEVMSTYCTDFNYDLFMLLITDIVLGGSEVLVEGRAKELAAKAFSINLEDDSIFLPSIVSRKKQIVPKLNLASQVV